MTYNTSVSAALSGTPQWRYYDTTDDNPEHALVDSMLCEHVDITGHLINIYFPLYSWDSLYGEDPSTNLSDVMVSKMIYPPSEENSIIESFGISSDETLSFGQIPKTIFIRDCSTVWFNTPSISATAIHPIPGMVIHTVWNDRTYEVVNVGDYQFIHQARKPVWEMILRPFRYSLQSLLHHQLFTSEPSGSFNTPTSAADGTPVYDDILKFGDNTMVETDSDAVDSYHDIDQSIFGR